MSEKNRPKVSTYNLVTGEDTYASQTAQDPSTARRVLGWIPTDEGIITRQVAPVAYNHAGDNLGGTVHEFYEFDQNDSSGNIIRFYYAVAATDFVAGTKTCHLYQQVAGVWTLVSAVGTLANPPAFVTINNLLHMYDGSVNWIFDGSNWITEGLPVPNVFAPGAAVGAGPGFTAAIGRFYWITWADQTVNRVHESSTSNAYGGTVGTGPITNKNVVVTFTPYTATVANGGTSVTISGALANISQFIGMVFYIDGLNFGVISATPDSTHFTLATPAPSAKTNKNWVAAPSRCTHWHIYASESDGSKVGQFLASVPITTMSYNDTSPFISNPVNTFTSIFRPVRNDPFLTNPSSLVATVHKYRIFRRVDSKPNFFAYSAKEEVEAYANGSPQESFPGIDPNTQSDLINETSYPDQSNRIRAMVSHADALYIFTEQQGLPLFGESIDDFGLSQVAAFSVGAAGRFAALSTPHGLAFMSYDRKIYLYPSANYPWAYVPKDISVTEQLIEIGKPLRKKLEQIKFSMLDYVKFTYYQFGRRDWLVVCWIDKSNVWHTWIYNFGTKNWFESYIGFSATYVLEVSDGVKILVGGYNVTGAVSNSVVIDDLTGTYVSVAAMGNAIFRPALIDFNDPDHKHVLLYIEFELTNPAMATDLTINFYLDPKDVDGVISPLPTPRSVQFSQVRGANLYRGFFKGGSLCQRALLEFNAAASTNQGSIRGLKLVADVASSLIF